MITPRMTVGVAVFVLAAGLFYWAWSGGGQMTTINSLPNAPGRPSAVVPAEAGTHTPQQN